MSMQLNSSAVGSGINGFLEVPLTPTPRCSTSTVWVCWFCEWERQREKENGNIIRFYLRKYPIFKKGTPVIFWTNHLKLHSKSPHCVQSAPVIYDPGRFTTLIDSACFCQLCAISDEKWVCSLGAIRIHHHNCHHHLTPLCCIKGLEN